jgi:hypothetical protein
VKTIQEIAEIQIGYQLRGGLEPDPEGTHQVVQAQDIDTDNDHQLLLAGLRRITPEREAHRYLINNGDVLFLSRGRKTYATPITELLPSMPPTLGLSHFFILRPHASVVDAEFLAWAINQAPTQSYLQRVSQGTGIPFIAKQDFAALEIEVPPLERQLAIARAHKLSRQERQLLLQLEKKRCELVEAICMAASKGDQTR